MAAMRRRRCSWAVGAAVLLVIGPLAAAAESAGGEAAVAAAPFPVNEKLTYAVTWMGIHCGQMEIVSFVDAADPESPVYRIVVLMRTTKFFDGIYRVRSRLDSWVDPELLSSVRYEERSLEKKKRKEEVWVVDLEKREVVRTKNGTATTIPVDVERAFDPLAFIYRLRAKPPVLGEERVLGLMTSKGAVETVVTATEKKRVRTKMGRCEAIGMVPQPRDEMMFSKSGAMTVWIDAAEAHRPCRIEFDLSFGTLVASLKSHADATADDIFDDWENWGRKR